MENDIDKNLGTTGTPETGTGSEEKIDYESLYQEASKSLLELTAERDSLLHENESLRAAKEQAISDGAKAREMNYTLSRQLNVAQSVRKIPEEVMASMFLKKGE